MLWVKAFHIISVITWFAALFYLPRLFVYHALSSDALSRARFKVMERKLYRGIMTPSLIVTVALGGWLSVEYWAVYAPQMWFQLKLGLVGVLVIYHFYCGHIVALFRDNRNTRTDKFYRWLNEFPVLILVAVVILVVVKPW